MTAPLPSEYQAFLAPVSADAPCGTDLDETGEMFTLEQSLCWLKAEAPVWRELRGTVERYLVGSRDLRLAVAAATIGLNVDGPAAFAAGLQYTRELLQTYWQDLFPKIEEDGNADSRRNALMNLTSFYRVLKPLHRWPIVQSREIGKFSILDIDVAEQRTPPPADYDAAELPQLSSIDAAFQSIGAEAISASLASFDAMLEHVAAINDLFSERVPETGPPDMQRLLELLERGRFVLLSRLPDTSVPAASTDGDGTTTVAIAAADGRATSIASRRDALAAIERAIAYFREYEPSSPVPVLLERAVKLADSDFLSIIQDIAPEAVPIVNLLSGRRSE